MPLPYIACQMGWIVAEVGRQPWIVYGLLKTSDGVSKAITPAQVSCLLRDLPLLYGVLGAGRYLSFDEICKKGPG